MADVDSFDVIIIGAGVAGLISALYLIKKGLKVLIVESYDRIGGCCSSFSRGGYKFDTGVHYLGGLRSGGPFREVLDDLELTSDLAIERFDPYDVIVLPNARIRIHGDLESTIVEFTNAFPNEELSLRRFFYWITKTNFIQLFNQTSNLTFKDLLDQHFHNDDLKQALSIFLGNIGLPSYRCAAIAAILLYRDYILDGGYYPIGGIQSLPDLIGRKIVQEGGVIRTSSRAKRLSVDSSRYAKGVELETGEIIKSDYVISACDGQQSYLQFIPDEYIPTTTKNHISSLVPSMSATILYLGLNIDIRQRMKDACGHWISPDYKVDSFYEHIYMGNTWSEAPHFLAMSNSLHDSSNAPDGASCLTIFAGTGFKDKSFWQENKQEFSDRLLILAEQNFGSLTENIVIKEMATPNTIINYTSNSRGSIYGWAATNEQILTKNCPTKNPIIKNYFGAGHWATLGYGQGGVLVSAISGKRAASEVLNNYCSTHNK